MVKILKKKDILLLCHEQQGHPRVEKIIQRVKKLCSFPEMIYRT